MVSLINWSKRNECHPLYKNEKSEDTVLPLVKSAIESEIARLELALNLADKRLRPFEEKYDITSAKFISEMTAEDLDDGDDEYVSWAGEYKLMRKLEDKLRQLREIKYDTKEIF